MSGLRKTNKVIAVVGADIHLSHRPPIARSAEPSWYDAMRRPLTEIRDLMDKYKCPFVVAGDIFHKWDSPAELINFAIGNLPEDYAVPGNHDLPNHVFEDAHKSAYWTLIQAGIVSPISGNLELDIGLALHGFPCGFRLSKLYTMADPKLMHVAVVHAYCWGPKGSCYAGADPIDYADTISKKYLHGYTAAVYGDNHVPFQSKKVFNCGGLMRRRFDEIEHRPRVGLLHSKDSVVTITSHELDCSKDVFADREVAYAMEELDMEELLNEINNSADSGVDFVQQLKFAAKKSSNLGVRKLIHDCLRHHES